LPLVTIGTFIGTGRQSGIFTDADIESIENSKGMHSKMEKALFADSIATSVGALLGTSSTTTYVESSAGINAGGRTGLTSVVVAILFALMLLISPIAGIVPGAATAPALIIVGVMMVGSFADIDWHNFEEVLPVFFTIIFMVVTYSITNGIAIGFIVYVITKLVVGKSKEIHPIIWGSSAVFIVYFILMALKAAVII
jgi:AGZA family xanthine/uracil permease-like MFS transporter